MNLTNSTNEDYPLGEPKALYELAPGDELRIFDRMLVMRDKSNKEWHKCRISEIPNLRLLQTHIQQKTEGLPSSSYLML